MDEHPGTKLKEILQSYMNVKQTMTFTDDKLSFFMFCITTYLASNMYFSISFILQSNITVLNVVLCSFVNSVVCFTLTTVSASLVSEESERVAMQLYQKYPMKFCYCKQDMHFTIWKIAAIRRSFIIATLGTMFTYAVLFDTFGQS
ncbi:hypothetical protein TNCT_586491 [Trichonephila clavata]|uniref:Uncharacterized protein n=1 Tax=Trichonephila clavata TaxID=2740835 RepID=A0A8X6G799_TRICU|nr:hypothetical protein TNCT_586491 [Trichonephila clavata]